ncbi:isopentenyl phosphate kinase family protein [Candidatus Woesebacteria bacterium]|nr:MAG: isopentenyl phosphate kinase family protein [Candidatus Woesebacteria bacterium]
MEKLTLIKLGGSLITDKTQPFTERKGTIARLARELSNIQNDKSRKFIIGHGGGSYPHFPAKKYQTNLGVINDNSYMGIAKVQDAASKLNRILTEQLIKANIQAVSFSPSSFMISNKGKIVSSYIKPIIVALNNKIVPVVYGDVIFDQTVGCTIASTEMVLNHLARSFRHTYEIEKIIYCGITHGVYDRHGKTIEKIDAKIYSKIQNEIGSSAGIDVTGGMNTKVKEALELSKRENISSYIINGNLKNNLINAYHNKPFVGTIIAYK